MLGPLRSPVIPLLLTLLCHILLTEARQSHEDDVHALLPAHPQKNSSYPSTFVPACHNSEDACNHATSFCTGHGRCVEKKRLGAASSSKSAADDSSCWTCVCSKTRETTKSGGEKVTEWTGTSCQKQDISAQFILLAGFSILLVAVIAWAIGLLYQMGAEELPSVIGAGVAGPKAGGSGGQR